MLAGFYCSGKLLFQRLFGIHDSDVPVSIGEEGWAKYIAYAQKAQSKISRFRAGLPSGFFRRFNMLFLPVADELCSALTIFRNETCKWQK